MLLDTSLDPPSKATISESGPIRACSYTRDNPSCFIVACHYFTELMEEKSTKQSDKSSREDHESQIEHYIIERIAAVNIDSRKLIFKKKK